MNTFATITSRLFDKVFRKDDDTILSSEPCDIDPLTAIALVESKHIGATAFCGPLPESLSDETFSPTTGENPHLLELHTALLSPNPRSAFASAMGLALAGERATVFLKASDVYACQDLLVECVSQHLPIVIHVALCDESESVTYDAYLASSTTGCMQFLASTSQEAIDYSMFARKVAEESLVPAIVAVDTFSIKMQAQLPSDDLADTWLGRADRIIACPNEAQRLMFGNERRQVPDKWNLERPVMLSPLHKHSSPSFRATRAPYYDNQLPTIIAESEQEWQKLTGRSCASTSQTASSSQDVLYVCQGAMYGVVSAVDSMNAISIQCLRPFPSAALLDAATSSKEVVILDTTTASLCGDSQFATEIKAALSTLPCKVSVVHCMHASTEDITALAKIVEDGGELPGFIGVAYQHDDATYPKQTSALQELARACPEVSSLALASSPEAKANSNTNSPSTSLLLDSNLWEDQFGNLPHFWDHIGTLYNDGNERLLTASPLLSTNAIPPLTAALRRVDATSRVLPAFDPMHCDGDASLWMSCPDGSVSALVLSPKALLDAGISKAGGSAAGLRSIAGGLCKQMVAVAKTDMQPTVGELLSCAFEILNPPEERREALQKGLDAVIEAIGIVPIAKTPTFFDKDVANEFLILCVDPDACKSPELVIAACAGHGIEPTVRTEESVRRARELRDLILELPDTSGDTIQRVSQLEDMKLPAIMLSRHCHHAMAAGDNAEVGSGSKLVLRQALGLAEYALQPQLQSLLVQIEELKGSLQSGATTLLADAIPSSNLEAIAKAIEKSGQDEVDLATVLGSMGTSEDAPAVNGEAVRMMASLATDLETIASRLTQSSGGLGRARSGLTISGSATGNWAATFPWNPFSTPVAVNTTHTGCSMSVGLFEGQMQRVLADLNTIRKAKLVLDNPIKAAHPDKDMNASSLRDLTLEERALCPPLLIVADAASMHRNALSELAWILDSDLPVKVLVFGEGVDDVALFGLTSCNAFIAQCSPSHPDHFSSSMLGALQYDGPALVSVYAPSPNQHGFAVEDLTEQAQLAVDCRVCPLFSYDPSQEGIFGTCIDITANENYTSTLVTDAMTPSAWATSQKRFTDGFYDEKVILARWQMLQELSGVVTPFDAVAREEQGEAAAQHKVDLEKLTQEYETKMGALREQYHVQAVASVTSGLMNMASQARKDGGN
jgi:pyruvate/2-oxoacid:ferredoxin oxidoreductase alpha subunit